MKMGIVGRDTSERPWRASWRLPLLRTLDVAPLVARARPDTAIIDTSNDYPGRDGRIAAIEAGQVESLWDRRTTR